MEDKMPCRICGKHSGAERECQKCSSALMKGVDDSTLKLLYSDDQTKKVWAENGEIAEKLARAYYGHLLEGYGGATLKKDSRENFGFNCFADGIRCGLDIVMPLLDEETREKARTKVSQMLQARKKAERPTNL